MASISVTPGSALGTALTDLLVCDEIIPGSAPSYEICKTIFLFHPLGQKMTEGPIKIALNLPREISVPDGPEDDVADAFNRQWDADEADKTICNVATQARVYGIASLALLEQGVTPNTPLKPNDLADAEIVFNVLDPLNTAGSLVGNQDPNAMDFQKHRDISVNGVRYHRSRTVTIMNEQPIYIAYTTAAFGFVGRSVFQRALFPLKSFVQTMNADDMVARKVGLLIATIKMAGSVLDDVMNAAAAFKRWVLQRGSTNNVLSITEDEKVESLNLQNLDEPLTVARKDILENIAAADDMPAVMLNSETFAQGFGEGSEDAKRVAQYIDGKRKWMIPLFTFMDQIIQRRAWNQNFYATIQKKFPEEYGKMPYEEAFYRWQNSFTAVWPSLLQEPESDQLEALERKFKVVIAAAQIMLPELDPENKAKVLMWIADTINSYKKVSTSPLLLDYDALESYVPPDPMGELKEPTPNKPFSANDSSDPRVIPISRRLAEVESFLGRMSRQARK